MNEVHGAVIQIVAEILDLDEDEITIGASLARDLGAEALDVIEILDQLQTRFRLEIPDDEAELITTVGELVAAFERRRD